VLPEGSVVLDVVVSVVLDVVVSVVLVLVVSVVLVVGDVVLSSRQGPPQQPDCSHLRDNPQSSSFSQGRPSAPVPAKQAPQRLSRSAPPNPITPHPRRGS
jgi:hypothetical protein